MSRRRAVASLAAAAAISLTVPLAAGAAAPLAPYATTAPATVDVAVHLTTQTPLVPEPGGTLTLGGYLENDTEAVARDVTVRMRLSPTPVRSRDEIGQILAGEAGRTGIAIRSTVTLVATELDPGARAPFSLSVPLDDLGLPATGAEVVVLGVESVADIEDDGTGPRQTGFTRTFLPWFPQPDAVAPTRVTFLLPLSTLPARDGDGVFLDEHLGVEVGPEGRLRRLLDAARSAPAAVAWVVDPALLESLQDMTDGYDVRTVEGDVVPGTHASDARSWLADLRSLVQGAEVTASPYALPDAVALHRAGLDLDIALAATTQSELPTSVLGVPVATGLAWPTNGLSDDTTLDALRASGARVVVLGADSFPPSPPVAYTPSGSIDLAAGGSPLRAALSDPTVSRLAAAPRRTPDPGLTDSVVRRQTAIAEIAMTTLELPTTSRSLVVAPDPWWRVDGLSTRDLISTLTSPWSAPQSLSALVAAPPSDIARDRVDYPPAAQASELSPTYLASVAEARSDLAALRSVAPDTTDPVSAGLEAALTRAESGGWRRDRPGARVLLTTITTAVADETDAVSVLSRAPVSLPGESGVIPVTVANDLDRPAKVGLRLQGTPRVRFEADEVEPVTIAPGQKQTFEVEARVLGTGPVTVRIALITPEGEVFGTPAVTEVRSAAYARAAQGVVLSLFGILVLLLGANFVRRVRAARRPAVDAPSDGDEGGTA